MNVAFATDEESRSKSPTGDGDVEIADGKQSPMAFRNHSHGSPGSSKAPAIKFVTAVLKLLVSVSGA